MCIRGSSNIFGVYPFSDPTGSYPLTESVDTIYTSYLLITSVSWSTNSSLYLHLTKWGQRTERRRGVPPERVSGFLKLDSLWNSQWLWDLEGPPETTLRRKQESVLSVVDTTPEALEIDQGIQTQVGNGPNCLLGRGKESSPLRSVSPRVVRTQYQKWRDPQS